MSSSTLKTAQACDTPSYGDDKSAQTSELRIGLLTGCRDRPYAFGLAMALISADVCLDVIGGDEVDSPEYHTTEKLNFINLWRGERPNADLTTKISKVLRYYGQLIRYVAVTKSPIFHILWNNSFELLDRTLLMLYYKAQGKKIAITAHNINQRSRDANDSWLNRATLRIQYKLADHIFVHTKKMKLELVDSYGVSENAVSIIRHPINDAFPNTELTVAEAKRRLDVANSQKTILFFGRIRPYKGLEHLIAAFRQLAFKHPEYRLVIAGEPKKGAEKYLREIEQAIEPMVAQGQIIRRIQFIPDEDVELYFKASDVLVLPYNDIFQSGVLFLGYTFGLPVIATDVGSFREDIIEGKTGYICRPNDIAELARTIEVYFESDLFRNLDTRRFEIRDYFNRRHSWKAVGEATRSVYVSLLEGKGTWNL